MLRHLRTTAAFTVCALMAGAGIAVANEHNEQTVIRSRDFTIPSGQCPQLDAGLELKGLGLEQSITVVDSDQGDKPQRDGEQRLFYRLSSTITGTATDNLGGTYTFAYKLQIKKPVSLPGTGIVTDTFKLSGTGPADGMSTFIRAKVTLDSGANPIAFEILEQSGDPFQCDPL
jgi:hypothetical protein